MEDPYYNKASGPIPGMLVLLNGKPFAEIAAGNQAITRIDDIVLTEPGIYRFSLQTLDGTISGESNPVWVQQHPPYRIYWGDTHGRSGFAEGQGTPEGFFRFGRDEARRVTGWGCNSTRFCSNSMPVCAIGIKPTMG